MAQSPESNATSSEVIRYDLGWNAINAMLRAGRSLSGHERNCCFLGTGGDRFADVSGVAGLDLADDGRVLALADWDYDGDVDFWIANRSGPQLRYLQNNLVDSLGTKASTNFFAIHLQGVDCNRDGIGARVTIEMDGKPNQTRSLRAGDGYLSQSTKWLHFGVGGTATISKVTIQWPMSRDDESGRQVQTISNLATNRWYRVVQGEEPYPWKPTLKIRPLSPSDLVAPPVSDRARISLLNPVPLPNISCSDASGTEVSLTQSDLGPRLVNIWASWCQPCLAELTEWSEHREQFQAAGLTIVLVNVDQSSDEKQAATDWLAQQDLPFQNFFGDEETAARFDVIQRSLLSRQRPLPIPTSFLIDGDGQLRVVYKGPVPAETLLRDTKRLTADRATLLAAATPFQGKWLTPPGGSTPLQLAIKLIEGDRSDDAIDYITSLVASQSPHVTSSLLNLQGAMLSDKKRYREAAQAYRQSLERDPSNRQAHSELGFLLLGSGQGKAAEQHFVTLLEASPNDPSLRFKLGMSYLMQHELDKASIEMQRVLKVRPMPLAHWHLGDIAIAKHRPDIAIEQYEKGLALEPSLIDKANNLAWLLATTANEAMRDGDRAVVVAEGYSAAIKEPTPHSLDTLAAAYAAAGRFGKAAAVAANAAQLAKETGDLDLAKTIRKRIDLYQQRKPFVDEP